MRRIKADKKTVLKLRLLNREIGAGVFQLIAERDSVLARDRGKILTQIGGEIQRDLLCLFGVLITQVVDAHHRVIDEVRPHLQHHDAGALIGDLTLLTHKMFYIVREDNAEHRQRADDDPE